MNTKALLDSELQDSNYINAQGKDVIVIGGVEGGDDQVVALEVNVVNRVAGDGDREAVGMVMGSLGVLELLVLDERIDHW